MPEMLGSAAAHPESRDDLVEDEHDPVFRGQFPQPLEKSGLGRNEPHIARDGLDDDAGDVLPVPSHGGLECVEIIEGDRKGELACTWARRGFRDAEGGHAGARLDEQSVSMTMIAALEFDDLLAFVNPRASRMADMVASVPELTMRT